MGMSFGSDGAVIEAAIGDLSRVRARKKTRYSSRWKLQVLEKKSSTHTLSSDRGVKMAPIDKTRLRKGYPSNFLFIYEKIHNKKNSFEF